MSSPDPEHMNFLVKNIDAIVTGAVVMLLGVLRILGRKETAKTATDIVKERPVTHDEVDAKLLRCQLRVQDTLNANFREFRKEFMEEVRALHIRLDNENR